MSPNVDLGLIYEQMYEQEARKGVLCHLSGRAFQWLHGVEESPDQMPAPCGEEHVRLSSYCSRAEIKYALAGLLEPYWPLPTCPTCIRLTVNSPKWKETFK